jgi:protein TonB
VISFFQIKTRGSVWKKTAASISLVLVATGRILSHFFYPLRMSLLPAFLSDSLDEVVFEGRNQAYGAYQLRQDYQQHLASAGGITLAIGAALLLGWAGWKQLAPAPLEPLRTHHEIKLIDIPPAVVAIEKPKMAVLVPPRAQAVATHTVVDKPTEVVKDDVPQPHLTTPTPTEDTVDGPTGPTAVGDPSAVATTGPAGPASGPADASGNTTNTNEPFIAVEKMPEFAGGQAALLRYLQKHLRYPGSALAAGVGGRVFMSFVVGADGSISDVTILKGLGYGLDEEAQRVVRQMPAWVPGYQSKHAVPVRFTLPITFAIQ